MTSRTRICEIGVDRLSDYAEIPISVCVDSVLRIKAINHGLGGILLVEEPVQPPYTKDYDREAPEGERVIDWPTRFDTRNWGFFLAIERERNVGGATVAFDAPGVNMLEGRKDLAVLWDIRVHTANRGHGIGSQLFRYAVEWARMRGCRQLKIETQNVNVRACRFYASQGCTLGAIHRYGYAGQPEVAHEAMLLWYLELA
jgi:GNAT superfamily N-acetyltransferase